MENTGHRGGPASGTDTYLKKVISRLWLALGTTAVPFLADERSLIGSGVQLCAYVSSENRDAAFMVRIFSPAPVPVRLAEMGGSTVYGT